MQCDLRCGGDGGWPSEVAESVWKYGKPVSVLGLGLPSRIPTRSGSGASMAKVGEWVRQLTDVAGVTTNLDGSSRVELPSPFAYSGRATRTKAI
jgi:hypothetical protein